MVQGDVQLMGRAVTDMYKKLLVPIGVGTFKFKKEAIKE